MAPLNSSLVYFNFSCAVILSVLSSYSQCHALLRLQRDTPASRNQLCRARWQPEEENEWAERGRIKGGSCAESFKKQVDGEDARGEVGLCTLWSQFLPCHVLNGTMLRQTGVKGQCILASVKKISKSLFYFPLLVTTQYNSSKAKSAPTNIKKTH